MPGQFDPGSGFRYKKSLAVLVLKTYLRNIHLFYIDIANKPFKMFLFVP